MSRARRFHQRQAGLVVLTVMLTDNMPSGRVALVTRATHWHMLIR